MTETVLTSRRAWLVVAGGPVPGRLRLSDRTLRFTPADGSAPVELLLPEVRRIALRRGRRGALLVESGLATLHLRCFGARGVAGLLLQARRPPPPSSSCR